MPRCRPPSPGCRCRYIATPAPVAASPGSLRLNTEMGLLVHSEGLNAVLRADVEPDFALTNAWRLEGEM